MKAAATKAAATKAAAAKAAAAKAAASLKGLQLFKYIHPRMQSRH